MGFGRHWALEYRLRPFVTLLTLTKQWNERLTHWVFEGC